LAQAIVLADSGRKPLSIASCDVDHFKQFNDRFGHKLGDQVIRLVAGKLKNAANGDGFSARYGDG
jgi:diguanylate cyclase